MATFRTSIDLLKIPGAVSTRFASDITLPDGGVIRKGVDYICIPADYNEVNVKAKSENDKTRTAYLNLRIKALADSYIQKVKNDKMFKGEDVKPGDIETHELKIHHSRKFIDAWRQRIEPGIFNQHPDWQGLDPHSTSNRLGQEIDNRINVRLGKVYPVIFDQSAIQQQAAFAMPPVEAQVEPVAYVQDQYQQPTTSLPGAEQMQQQYQQPSQQFASGDSEILPF